MMTMAGKPRALRDHHVRRFAAQARAAQALRKVHTPSTLWSADRLDRDYATSAKLDHHAAHLLELLFPAHERFVHDSRRDDAAWVGAAWNDVSAVITSRASEHALLYRHN
jgi:hypothetical protein